MQERESRHFGCTLCGYWRPRDPTVWWCAWQLASWAAALLQGQRDAQPHRGGETRGKGIVQSYRGEKGDIHLGTSSRLRGRVERFSKKYHSPQNRRQLCPLRMLSMLSNITDQNPPKSQSCQSLLGTETTHHQHIHMVLLFALQAKLFLSQGVYF